MWKPYLSPSLALAFLSHLMIAPLEQEGVETEYRSMVDQASFVVLARELSEDTGTRHETPYTTAFLWMDQLQQASYRLMRDIHALVYHRLQAFLELRLHYRVVWLRKFVRDWYWDVEYYIETTFAENRMLAALFIALISFAALLWMQRKRWQEQQRPRARTLSDSQRPYNKGPTVTKKPSRVRLWTSSSRDQLTTNGSSTNVFHRSSRDLIRELELEEDPQQRAFMELQNNTAQVKEYYYGPSIETIVYETFTPPPSWGEASRKLYPQDPTRMQLQREISLSLTESASLIIQEPSKSTGSSHGRREHGDRRPPPLQLPVNLCSVHPQPPAGGGVLEIYVKDSPRDEWMEHTFTSAHDAAQFQIDLLALQLLGDSTNNMFQALRIVHQGSVAHAGKEFVLHDRVLEEKVDDAGTTKSACIMGGGIAWDDVMRCLGSSFPVVKSKLERLWWIWWLEKVQTDTATPSAINELTELPANTDSAAATSGDEGAEHQRSLHPEYLNKRMLLGPVDFFRLFVPSRHEMEVPQSKSTRSRMEQMLRWRKRVARASVLVQAYTRARTVANKGWSLNRSVPENYLKTRLAFDDNVDNYLRDQSVTNEMYEATVSRDVICHVRSPDVLKSKPRWSFGLSGPKRAAFVSGYQGYTLVAAHIFQLPPEGTEDPFRLDRDPLLSIPSLRAVVEANPDVEFFVSSIHSTMRNAAWVYLFARSLPVGIDPQFDNVVDRFKAGDEELRNRKLEVMFQLGKDQAGMSYISWAMLTLLSFLLRWNFCSGNTRVPLAAVTNERTPIPAVKVANCGETHHFGGFLQSNQSLPINYVAFALRLDSRLQTSFVTRILLTYLEQEGGFAKDVIDFTWVLAGELEDELPERALCTYRLAHTATSEIALPIGHNIPSEVATRLTMEQEARLKTASLYFRIFVTDPTMAAFSPVVRGSSRRRRRLDASPVTSTNVQQLVKASTSDFDTVDVVDTVDPIEKAVNALVEILGDVTTPVRKSQITHPFDASSADAKLTISKAAPAASSTAQISILRKLSRSDIRRFFIASNCSLKQAAVRIVESTAWRGLTFPISTISCRIELQNGQFFQQGRDLDGNPVYYFRNTLLGPWRKDEDAVIAAVLHRLETSMTAFARESPDVRCTLIVLMGKPFRKKRRKGMSEDSAVVETATEPGGGSVDDKATAGGLGSIERENVGCNEGATIECESAASALVDAAPMPFVSNPRIQPDEQWLTHSSKQLIRRLIDTVTAHYPERLGKALVVVGKGNTAYTRTAVGGMLSLPKVLGPSRTRDKVRFLIRYPDLQDYVAKDELSVLVGGNAPLDPAVFEVR